MTKIEQYKTALENWGFLHKTRLSAFTIKQDGSIEAVFDEQELAFTQVFTEEELKNC